MKNYRRSLLILAFFCSFILILQFARMGVLNNANQYQNAAPEKPVVRSLTLPEAEPPLKVLIVRDLEDDASIRCVSNFSSLLDKYRVPYATVSADGKDPIPSDVSCLIMTVPDFSRYRNYGNLFSFAAAGGSVIFAAAPVINSAYNALSGTLGITEYTAGGYSDGIVDQKGVVGPAGTAYSDTDLVLYSTAAHLRSVCEVYLEDDEGNPLLWRLGYGRGALYVSNSNVISNLTGRGVVSEILSEIAGKSFLYPAYGIVTSALESFPGPTIAGDFQLFREYRMNYDSFVKNILWVDLLKMTRRYGIVHTLSFVQSYDSNTKAPFSEGSLLSTALLTYGGEVLANGGEIAYHGLFYRPFGLKGDLTGGGWFIPWNSVADMKSSINLADQFYHKCFPSYTVRCYFPPEGRISERVMGSLREIMPDVRILCIPYHNNLGDQMFGDFQEDSYGFFHYSITSGIEGARWNAQNSLLSLGILSQSVDIPYAVTVNRIKWADIVSALNDIYEDLFDRFPYMQPMKITDAAERIRWYEDMDFRYSEDETGLDVAVDGYFDGICFLLRTEKDVPATGGGYTAHLSMPGVYLVRPAQPQFRIEWGN